LDEATGRALLKFARHLYPHDTMEDAVYAMVVKALDKGRPIRARRRFSSTESPPSTALPAATGWRRAPIAAGRVKALEGTPFFGKVRGTCVGALYDNPLATLTSATRAAPGESGYLQRGFNDLKWLPDPPANASPPLTRPGA